MKTLDKCDFCKVPCFQKHCEFTMQIDDKQKLMLYLIVKLLKKADKEGKSEETIILDNGKIIKISLEEQHGQKIKNLRD